MYEGFLVLIMRTAFILIVQDINVQPLPMKWDISKYGWVGSTLDIACHLFMDSCTGDTMGGSHAWYVLLPTKQDVQNSFKLKR